MPDETKLAAEMTVAELDDAYGELDDYPKSGNKDDKVAFAEEHESSKPERETAFVLDPDAAFADVPVHFGGFPGVWSPDQPISARAVLEQLPDVDTIDDLKGRVEELALPLKVKLVETDSAPMPVDPVRIPSEEEVRAGEAQLAAEDLPDAELLPAGTLTAAVAETADEDGDDA